MYKLEIWKNIDGFKYYQISNLGNISAVCRGKKDYAYGYKWKYRSDINV